MKKITILSALVLFLASAFTPVKTFKQAQDIPAKTVCIKNPAADNTAAFFTGATSYVFEVYKAGSPQEVAKIKSALEKDAAVESVNIGAMTGDYQALTLNLRSAKNKEWFVKAFKSAGLNTIRINRNPIVPVDKM